jgi:hypothetical protein
MGDVLNGPRGKKTSPISSHFGQVFSAFSLDLELEMEKLSPPISDGDLSRRVKLNAIEQIEHVERSEQIERS